MTLSQKRGFTLVELLITGAIVVALAVIVVLTLNPVELLRQARDSSRASDLARIDGTITLLLQDSPTTSLGSASTTYLSIPDPVATSSAGDQCQGLNLHAIYASSTGFTYHCASLSSYRNVDGTGWIPVKFNGYSSGSPLGQLPVDPVNQTSSGFYYTYTTDGASGYEVTAIPESQKQRTAFLMNSSTNPILPLYPGVEARGTNPALSELYYPSGLVGYWNFDEGGGSLLNDVSGNGNTATWGGTLGNQYGAGRIGTYSGVFNGIDNQGTIPANAALQNIASAGTISVWINYSISTTSIMEIFDAAGTGVNGLTFKAENGPTIDTPQLQYGDGAGIQGAGTSTSLSTNTWYFLTAVWAVATGTLTECALQDGGCRVALYQNGVLQGWNDKPPSIITNSTMYIGSNAGNKRYMAGSFDDLRVYNRVLSPAEIQALYNAQK